MTRPPTHAPRAFARLRAAWLPAAARVWAVPATCMSRSWRLMTRTEASTDVVARTTRAATAYGAATAKSANEIPSPAMPMTTDRMTDQSPIRPATRLPTNPDSPKTRRNSGTADAGRPVTSVTVGAMYEYIANMPPNPIAPTPRVSHTWRLPKALSSLRTVRERSRGRCGTAYAMRTIVATPRTVTSQ